MNTNQLFIECKKANCQEHIEYIKQRYTLLQSRLSDIFPESEIIQMAINEFINSPETKKYINLINDFESEFIKGNDDTETQFFALKTQIEENLLLNANDKENLSIKLNSIIKNENRINDYLLSDIIDNLKEINDIYHEIKRSSTIETMKSISDKLESYKNDVNQESFKNEPKILLIETIDNYTKMINQLIISKNQKYDNIENLKLMEEIDQAFNIDEEMTYSYNILMQYKNNIKRESKFSTDEKSILLKKINNYINIIKQFIIAKDLKSNNSEDLNKNAQIKMQEIDGIFDEIINPLCNAEVMYYYNKFNQYFYYVQQELSFSTEEKTILLKKIDDYLILFNPITKIHY
jgi:hypothetical protein